MIGPNGIPYIVERSPDWPAGAVVVRMHSALTGREHSMLFGVPFERFMECRYNWSLGMEAKDAFPMLNTPELFFVTTGVPPAEKDRYYGSSS